MPEKIFYDLLRWIAKVFSYKEPEQNYLFPESKRAHSKSLNELLNMILLEELLKKKTTKNKNPDSQMEILRCSGNVANHCFFYFYLFLKKQENGWGDSYMKISDYSYYTSMALWQTSPRREWPRLFWKQKSHSVLEAHLKTLSTNSPFGDKVTAGIECILGSAIYLKSTGISLKIKNNVSE